MSDDESVYDMTMANAPVVEITRTHIFSQTHLFLYKPRFINIICFMCRTEKKKSDKTKRSGETAGEKETDSR